MTREQLVGWWWHRQGLDGSLEGCSAAEVLSRTGWARSVGGVAPYLTLFSRAGIGRAATDAAVADLAIHELPSARGCTHVVPQADFALALTVGQGFTDVSDLKTALKLGASEAELDKLCDEVVAALKLGPLDPAAIRDAAPSVRSFGEAGKRKGVTTTLPIALGRLQGQGRIRRMPVDGRLDQQRYRYALWQPNPLDDFKLSATDATVELARRFFTWIGPATATELRWFTGLGVKAARAAIEPLGLVPLDPGDERMMRLEDRAELARYKPPKKPTYALVGGLDGLFLLRRALADLVVAEHRDHSVFGEKGLVRIGALTDLPSHAIVDRGYLVGLWEYDPETQSIAWLSFDKPDKGLREAVARTEDYILRDLGDARSFSLDSPKSRAPRIAALRSAMR